MYYRPTGKKRGSPVFLYSLIFLFFFFWLKYQFGVIVDIAVVLFIAFPAANFKNTIVWKINLGFFSPSNQLKFGNTIGDHVAGNDVMKITSEVLGLFEA